MERKKYTNWKNPKERGRKISQSLFKGIIKKCEGCNKQLKLSPANAKQKFCQKCYLKYHGFKKGFTPWNKGKKGLYKNPKRAELNKLNPYWLRKKRKDMGGENHWNWKGGEIGRWRGSNWNFIRLQAMKRDNHICQICGSHKTLCVHHINSYRESKNSSLSNLITLCKGCHGKVEMGSI